MQQILVPKGTVILPTSWYCNTSEDIWGDDAQEWKPERWLSPLPETVKEARIPGIYQNQMTFSFGERSCVGMRFAHLELSELFKYINVRTLTQLAEVVLAVLLESFNFSPTDRRVWWNLCPVVYPTMSKDDVEPSLVLAVSRSKQVES